MRGDDDDCDEKRLEQQQRLQLLPVDCYTCKMRGCYHSALRCFELVEQEATCQSKAGSGYLRDDFDCDDDDALLRMIVDTTSQSTIRSSTGEHCGLK